MLKRLKNTKETKQNISDKKTVFVGLSGGVDSAVSAYLLKKAGFRVVGAFIKTWQPDWAPCTWKEERRDAMRVAAHLEIPFETIDLEKEYKREVADYMLSEYKKGRTPNPDVMCNKEIKFGAFLKKAISMGADCVVTGHYARVSIERSADGRKNKYQLLKARDEEKEQSYFLYTLRQEQLSRIMFPIGELQKKEVRKIAKKIGLPNAEKKDSQGICFLGKISMKDFLGHYIPFKEGLVLNLKGETIGFHNGAVFFTIGERHGFTITKKSAEDRPLYVVEKDIKKNVIVVGEKSDLEKERGKVRKEVFLTDINWITNVPENNKIYQAQIRYHQDFQKCKVVINKLKIKIIFDNFQTAASGQSVVIYEKDICLGGGVIE